jgi:hypothetical protein
MAVLDHDWHFVDGLRSKARCSRCDLVVEDSVSMGVAPAEAERLLYGGCPGAPVPPLRLMMPVGPPRAWNVGPAVVDGELLSPVVETLARVTLPGDMDTRRETGSLGARVLVYNGQELVAMLAPEQVGAIARFWLDNGVAVPGVVKS